MRQLKGTTIQHVHPHHKGTRASPSWVVESLQDYQVQSETGSLFDNVVDDEVNLDLAMDGKPINTNASVDLCIELGSGDIIDIDEDTNILLTIDINLFLIIYSYVHKN
jgi:hypothetical protein